MTKLLQYVEEMRVRLSEVANTEQALIRELGDALSQLDRQLLSDVRDLTMEHEARRVAVLSELQGLASRIGSFPAGADSLDALDALETNGHSLPGYSLSQEVESQSSVGCGDWRQAVNNIEDDIDTLFGRRGPAH
ncbi:MAG: hypothetical protein AB7O43_18125 [Hyphomicrobiaceae bacterium]